MEPNINIEEIEQYLEGSLQGEALEHFNKRLQNDKALAARVRLMKNMDPALEDEQALKVFNMTQNLGAEFFANESTEKKTASIRRIPFYRRPLAIAAAILMLVAIGFVIQMQMNGSLSNQELYAAYYSPYQANELSRGENPNDDIYQQAIQQYDAKDFAAAIVSFRQILSDNPDDIQAKFGLAHTYLNQSLPNFDLAANYFKQVISDGKSILVPKAKWYLALIDLEQDKVDEAKELLQELLDSEDDKLAGQARELLGKL